MVSSAEILAAIREVSNTKQLYRSQLYALIQDGILAGATLSTHLGNGCAQMLPRHPNVIWEQLAADALTASLIIDGHHLPPSTVKAMVRAKTLLDGVTAPTVNGFSSHDLMNLTSSSRRRLFLVTLRADCGDMTIL